MGKRRGGVRKGESGGICLVDKMCDEERGKEEETVRVREWNGIVLLGNGGVDVNTNEQRYKDDQNTTS